MEQRTDEWFAARCGKFTGSRFGALMARTKTGPSTSRANLIVEIALERVTGQPESTYENDAMRRGREMEAIARGAYEAHTGDLVEAVGFVVHPDLPHVGVSPDGYMGSDGLVEFKCPAAKAKHLAAIRYGDHAQEYRWQIQGQLWVTGRAWCDAVSFDPRFPSWKQLAIARVSRDEKAIKELAQAVAEAETEVAQVVSEIMNGRNAA